MNLKLRKQQFQQLNLSKDSIETKQTTIYRVLENLVDDGICIHGMTASSGMQCAPIVQNLNMRIYIPILNVLNVVKSIV